MRIIQCDVLNSGDENLTSLSNVTLTADNAGFVGHVLGESTINDGGEGYFIWNGTSWDRLRGGIKSIANGTISMHGGVGDGVTDNTAAFNKAKAAVGDNGTVYFDGANETYFFAGAADLKGVSIQASKGVKIKVGTSLGVDYSAWTLATDITLENVSRGKTYVLPANTHDTVFSKLQNDRRANYDTVEALDFTTNFSLAELPYNSGITAAPAVAPTTTAESVVLDAAIGALNFGGVSIEPRLGELVEVTAYVHSDNASGSAILTICDSVNDEYVGLRVYDRYNTRATVDHQIAEYRTGVVGEIHEMDRSDWILRTDHSINFGVKMVASDRAEFYVNHKLIGTYSLPSGSADKIFFGFWKEYQNGTSGFYHPVRYKGKQGAQKKAIKVAAFGDSITQGTHTVLPWPEFIPTLLDGSEEFTEVTLNAADNYGVSGDKSADQLVDMQAADLSSYDVICIMVGTNDIVQNVDYATYKANIEALGALASQSGRKVVFGLSPMFDATGSPKGGRYRAIVEYVCAQQGYTIADPLEALADNYDLFVGDDIHPTALGGAQIAVAFARAIRSLYKPNKVSDLSSDHLVGSRHHTSGAAMPSNGYRKSGDYHSNTNPSIQGATPTAYVVKGWIRVTTGNAHVLGTDWAEDRTPNF